MKKSFGLRYRWLVMVVVLFVALAQSASAPLAGTSVASAAGCVQPPVAGSHPANAVSPSGVSEKPSGAIGQIGAMPPLDGQPNWDGEDRVNAVASVGKTLVMAGDFRSYVWKRTTYPAQNVIAVDLTTGAPTGFAPTVDGTVNTVAFSCTGAFVYLGGSFHTVNGVSRHNLAKVNLSTGAVDAWNPNPNGAVETIVNARNHVVVGGSFSTIGGAARSGLASLSGTSSSATNWLNLSIAGNDPAGPKKVYRIAVNHQNSYAVITGNFNTISGKNHRRIAVLKLTNTKAELMPWATPLTASNNNSNKGTDCSRSFGNPERDVTFLPNDTRFGVVSTGAAHAGSICDSVSIWNAGDQAFANTTAHPLGINYTGGDTLSGITAPSNLSFIVSGHNRWANNPPIQPYRPVSPCNTERASGNAGYNCQNPGVSVERSGIYEVSVQTYKATAWNPGRSRQTAKQNAMLSTPYGVILGSDGDTAAGQPHNDIVVWPFGD